MLYKKCLIAARITVIAMIIALATISAQAAAPPPNLDYTPPATPGMGCYMVRYIDYTTLKDLATPTIYNDLVPGVYTEKPMPIPGFSAIAQEQHITVYSCMQAELQFFYKKDSSQVACQQVQVVEDEVGELCLGGGNPPAQEGLSPETLDASYTKAYSMLAVLSVGYILLVLHRQKAARVRSWH